MVNVGGINGDTVHTSTGDSDYAVVAHGYDDESSAYEANYDEIDDDIGENRWHVQSHFETLPANIATGRRGSQQPDYVNYSIFNPLDRNVTNFKNYEPDESDLSDSGGLDFSASISVPITPFFSLSTSKGINSSKNGSVTHDDYNKLKFHIVLDGLGDLPSREDDARIARFDTRTNGEAGESHPVNIYSKYGYYEGYPNSGQFLETDVCRFQANYDITN